MTAQEPQQLPTTRWSRPTTLVLSVRHFLHSLLLDGAYYMECNCKLMRTMRLLHPALCLTSRRVSNTCIGYVTLPNQLRPRTEDIAAVGEGNSGHHDKLKMDISAK